MARNPYLKSAPPSPPKQPYRLSVRGHERVITVDPDDLPTHEEGAPGSILALLLHAGIEVDHTCGGVCACSTCHVHVLEGLESCNEPSEEEEDQLDFAPSVRDDSRLACQCVPDGSVDVLVELPAWGRNEVSEEPH